VYLPRPGQKCPSQGKLKWKFYHGFAMYYNFKIKKKPNSALSLLEPPGTFFQKVIDSEIKDKDFFSFLIFKDLKKNLRSQNLKI
jgi:hypothetical protein